MSKEERMAVSRERAEEIADALTFAGDDWQEILDRVPEYDREFTESLRERLDRRPWRVTEDGVSLKDGTLLVRPGPGDRWTVRILGDSPPMTIAELVQAVRLIAAEERRHGNPHPLRSVVADLAWAFRRRHRR